MGPRRQRLLLEKVAPLMRADEKVELTAMAQMGSVRAAAAKTAVASTALSIGVAALGGGFGFVAFVAPPVYLVLTDEQLMLFEVGKNTGRPRKHLSSIPRQALTMSDFKDGVLRTKFNLLVEGSSVLKLTFGPIPAWIRRDGRALAAALPTVTADQQVRTQ